MQQLSHPGVYKYQKDYRLCSWRLLQKTLDLSHYLYDPLFLLENTFNNLLGREMKDILLGVRVLAIKVAIVGPQFGGRDFPGLVVLFPLLPPIQTGLELLKLEGLGFGVVLCSVKEWGSLSHPASINFGRTYFRQVSASVDRVMKIILYVL
jgi:hypothetical protein